MQYMFQFFYFIGQINTLDITTAKSIVQYDIL